MQQNIFKKMSRLLLLGMASIAIFAACDSSTAPVPTFSAMSLSFTDFDTLGDSLNPELYEAWVVVDGEYTSLGKFNIRFNGSVVDTNGAAITEFVFPSEVSAPSRVAVTIEPNPDPSMAPSAIEVLTGNIANVSSLQLGLSFKLSFAGRKKQGGNFMLISPSDGGGLTFLDDGPDTTNGVSGLWFIGKSWGSPQPGLFMDSLAPTGWMYEGWLLNQGTFVSLGRFNDGTKSDQSAFYYDTTGFEPEYHYPGEDFLINPPTGLTFPLDVRGSGAGNMCFVTLEPEPDNSPMPFMSTNFIIYCADINGAMLSNVFYPLTTPDLGSAVATMR